MIAEMNGINNDVVQILREKKMTISAAESCTGGLFAALVTEVAGASEILNESFVTYANSAKMQLLGVREETLARYGAVSEQTAREMAQGLFDRTGADITVGITGIAGPGGGTDEKPVGTVYAAVCNRGDTSVMHMLHSGSRNEIREKTCYEVFKKIKTLAKNV